MIPCELDLTSSPFCDTTIIAYEIGVPPVGKNIGLNLLNDEYFTIPYIIDKILNTPAGHQLPIQVQKMCV